MARLLSFVAFSVCSFLFVLAFSLPSGAEEACYSYGGGHVYPGEGLRSSEHAVHWSKAQSMERNTNIILERKGGRGWDGF